jgi:hypothetical protein
VPLNLIPCLKVDLTSDTSSIQLQKTLMRSLI